VRLDRDPSLARAHICGPRAAHWDHTNEALEGTQRPALKLAPDDPNAKMALAIVYLQQASKPSNRPFVRNRHSPENGNAHYQLGIALARPPGHRSGRKRWERLEEDGPARIPQTDYRPLQTTARYRRKTQCEADRRIANLQGNRKQESRGDRQITREPRDGQHLRSSL